MSVATLNSPRSKTAQTRSSSVPRALRAKVEPLLEENFDFMDAEIFSKRNVESQLFDDEIPALPLVGWYQQRDRTWSWMHRWWACPSL